MFDHILSSFSLLEITHSQAMKGFMLSLSFLMVINPNNLEPVMPEISLQSSLQIFCLFTPISKFVWVMDSISVYKHLEHYLHDEEVQMINVVACNMLTH